jgi:protein gp37
MFEVEKKYRLENNIDIDYIKTDCLNSDMFHFKPVFMYSQFAKPLPKKPTIIFMDSMSDIAYWTTEWMEKVLNKIKEYPQHQFLFLTKNPDIYYNFKFVNNIWYGATITNNNELCTYQDTLRMIECENTFISLEPIQEKINAEYFDKDSFKWLIIGAESGNRKNKIIPKIEWINSISEFCGHNKIPLFIKDNIYKIFPDYPLIQQFPKELLK